jgi:hypothetical protein
MRGLRATPASAQTDEIQVYNAEIAAPGIFNLAWHNNYAPSGRAVADFPGGIVPNHALNGVTEWAAVFDFNGKPWTVEGGIGMGLNKVTDHCVLKLILSHDFH